MKKIALFIITLISFVACDIADLEPTQTKAFMKFYGNDGNTEGSDLLKLSDGYLLLGNNIKADVTTAILIKVDLNGNKVWSNSFPAIKGSSLAQMTDGYFIIGDSINSDPRNTRMSLIKTDLQGNKIAEQYLGEPNTIGEPISYHGTAITISTINEVVVTGYTQNSTTSTDQAFFYGYVSNLDSSSWAAVRIWGQTGITRTTSKRLYEAANGYFVWTSLATVSNTLELQPFVVLRDRDAGLDNQPLVKGQKIAGDIGDYVLDSNLGVLVQTVEGVNKSIAIAEYDGGDEQPVNLIVEEGKDLFAQAIIRTTIGDYVILGSTTKNLDTTANSRTDLNFYITKVGIDGSVSSTIGGFTNYIGGTGNEVGAAIVEADDGGYVFLGTMLNTNEFKIMVLVKVNNKGELIN